MAVALLARSTHSRWLLQGRCDRAQHKTPNSFSRISLRVVGHVGLVADQKLAKNQRVEVLLKELAAVVPLAKRA
eukprot:4690500-Pleurochrysis_carterae.AAC.1